MIDSGFHYKNWMVDLKSKIQQSQIKAIIKVNSAFLELYWEMGKEISERNFQNTYGSGFFKQVSKDLMLEILSMKGFSGSNLKYIKLFYNQELIKSQQLVADSPQKLFLIPGGHHLQIFTKCAQAAKTLFYVNKSFENGWSRAVLMNMMSSNLFRAQSKFITNFFKILSNYVSELIKQTLKDAYFFDLISITENYREKEREDALIDNIQKFLIEIENGFTFVGKQVELKGKQSFFINLLFYHIKLKRYVVTELKSGNLQPEFAGKLNFYVAAVDKQHRDENHHATVGLIICKTKDDITAEYSLTDLHKPSGISSYELNKILTDNFKSSIPSIEDIENELKKIYNEKTRLRHPRKYRSLYQECTGRRYSGWRSFHISHHSRRFATKC